MNIVKMFKKLFVFILTLPIRIIKLFSFRNLINAAKSIRDLLSFISLLIAYLIMSTVVNITASRFCPNFLGSIIIRPVSKIYDIVVNLNRYNETSINRINLIELAIRNMKFKKSRTFITIGGMSIGIAAIVFLVSLGYGLQKMVTSRVARLDEMKQADVTTQPGSNVKINDKTLSDFNEFSNVTHTLPMIALVGKVNYNNSVADMAVYGVTSEYLQQSAVKPVKGDVFKSEELAFVMENESESKDLGKVAGATTEENFGRYKQILGEAEFSIYPEEWIKVRSEPSISSAIIGYTKRADGPQTGYQVYGSGYADNKNGKAGTDADNKPLGKWIKSNYRIWDLVNGEYIQKKTDDNQLVSEGYIAQLDTVAISTFYQAKELGGQVLGDTTTEDKIALDVGTTVSDTVNNAIESTANAAGTVFDNIVEINGEYVFLEDSQSDADKVKKVALSDKAYKQAVVNRAMLKILGLSESEAVNKSFDVSFIVPSTLTDNPNEKVESEPSTYTIVGVIPQDDSPFFYVPFIDLRSLGISNYSQIKIVSDDTRFLGDIRKKIESMGFLTNSVVDTVEQINNLFATARTVLALIGTVALAVAALGMFNTLTVSLLERIREIGLMKAMGMKSYEVKELFLTESMIMGFFGGVLGIGMGFLAGKLLSVILTAVAISSGVGVIDISYVPFSIIAVVLLLSIFVGLVTGLYPAKRATDISALNALRYE